MGSYLSRLEITNLRNLESVKIQPSPAFNLFYGNNGSGKTSFLESIYLLGLGRSFRTHLIERLICNEKTFLSVFANLEKEDDLLIPIGIQRNIAENTKIRIANENVRSAAKLAELLPIQLINPDSYSLLDSGPKYRRQFIDWGVFHVEQEFYSSWARWQRIITQRNVALKNRFPKSQVIAWDNELVTLAESIDKWRLCYFQALKPIFYQLMIRFKEEFSIDISYKRGWSTKLGYKEALEEAFPRDRLLGYTQVGPHKADMSVHTANLPAKEVLSRGQQKLTVILLRLAQGILLKQSVDKRCLYLLDDLPAEMDEYRLLHVMEILNDIDAQVFITGLDMSTIQNQLKRPVKMFHVEHGCVSETII